MIAITERLLAPAGIFADMTVRDVSEGEVSFAESPIRFVSQRLARHLKGCYRSTLLVCTLGVEIDEAQDQLAAQGETTRSLILDAIGSETAEALAERLNQNISQRAAKAGSPTRRRFSPGYADWPLAEQAKIFDLLEPQSIGVKLNEAFMMEPQKSISAIIGWERPAP
jgi:cobalamin-dependent methionine synthase I